MVHDGLFVSEMVDHLCCYFLKLSEMEMWVQNYECCYDLQLCEELVVMLFRGTLCVGSDDMRDIVLEENVINKH